MAGVTLRNNFLNFNVTRDLEFQILTIFNNNNNNNLKKFRPASAFKAIMD